MKLIVLLLSISVLLFSRTVISGEYKGFYQIEHNNLFVELEGMNTEKFSYYRDMHSAIKGDMAILYFDCSGDGKADYAAYIYNKTMVLKKASSSGVYNITVDLIAFSKVADNTTRVIIPTTYFSSMPLKVWTFKPSGFQQNKSHILWKNLIQSKINGQ